MIEEFPDFEEEQHEDPDELLDWLCWSFATTAERFYPPDETALECTAALYGDDYPDLDFEEVDSFEEVTSDLIESMIESDQAIPEGSIQKLYSLTKAYWMEYGTHCRALNDASEFFCDLAMQGYDPVKRTEREIEKSREEGLDLNDIDWSWLSESGYESRTDKEISPEDEE